MAPRTLLAHLVLELDHRVPADRLIDAVWGDHAPEAARNSLQTYVSHLRRVLGPDRLEGRAAGYALHGRPDEVDAVRFERLVDSARRAGAVDPAAAVHTYREALALWRGPALADFAYEPWAQADEWTTLDERHAHQDELDDLTARLRRQDASTGGETTPRTDRAPSSGFSPGRPPAWRSPPSTRSAPACSTVAPCHRCPPPSSATTRTPVPAPWPASAPT